MLRCITAVLMMERGCAMTSLDSGLNLREARDAYLAENGFSTAAYTDHWVRFKFGPLPIIFPATRTRREAIPFHDLHHVLTGYKATPVGESEIGAWEVASGLKRLWAGWVLDLNVMSLGMLYAPRRTYRAFIRGRHSRNLYGTEYTDRLLTTSVGDMRAQIGLAGEPPQATTGDKLAFAFWLCAGGALNLLYAVIVLVPLAALGWWLWA